MSQTAQALDLRQLVSEGVISVFDTMLSTKPAPVENQVLPSCQERVCGSVGFGGETVTGAVYLHFPEPLAQTIAATMLGLAPEELQDESNVNDVIGELCNMVAGVLKSHLCDAGAVCAVSTPAIIRGSNFQIESIPDVHQEMLQFVCWQHQFRVELHIKFNS
jgi:chemotaxis protein CheX